MLRIHHDRHDDVGSGVEGERAPRLISNWISITGGILAVCGLAGVLFFVIMDVLSHGRGSYAGMTLVPPLAVCLVGITLVPVGVALEWRRRRSGKPASVSGTLDLEIDLDSLTRTRVAWSIAVGTLALSLLVLSAGAGSLKLLEYTESNRFCAATCHEVMGPEAVTHLSSPHARVDCVECHVSEGADGYIRAKLNGVRQVWNMAAGDFRRPIPTPIHDGRPSQSVCVSCHWTDHFIDYKVLSRRYFHGDEENTPAEIKFMVKIGGGRKQDGLIEGAGIHYHMITEHKVEFVARDQRAQQIPWVRVTHPDGSSIEYENVDEPLSEEESKALPVRAMECVDCHSRPAHRFPKPIDSLNKALSAGAISRELPYVKREGVRLLAARYPSADVAMQGIADGLVGFYRAEYPSLFADRSRAVDQAVATLQDVYLQTVFPGMKASWSTYPDNIGHRDFPGCFRCHNDEMQSEDGRSIFSDCTKCHVILAQAHGENVIEARSNFKDGQTFLHYEDDDEVDDYTVCTDCHDGGFSVYAE